LTPTTLTHSLALAYAQVEKFFDIDKHKYSLMLRIASRTCIVLITLILAETVCVRVIVWLCDCVRDALAYD